MQDQIMGKGIVATGTGTTTKRRKFSKGRAITVASLGKADCRKNAANAKNRGKDSSYFRRCSNTQKCCIFVICNGIDIPLWSTRSEQEERDDTKQRTKIIGVFLGTQNVSQKSFSDGLGAGALAHTYVCSAWCVCVGTFPSLPIQRS